MLPFGAAGVETLRGVFEGPGPDDDVPRVDVTRAAELEVVERRGRVVGLAGGLVGTYNNRQVEAETKHGI